MLPCPLCQQSNSSLFHRDKHRTYFQCDNCALVFVPSEYYISTSEEKAIYDLHQNAVNDLGYHQFLSRMFEPMQCYIQPKSVGLDFGSGPSPVLATMFEQAGYRMAIYDYFYANNPDALQQKYDFITATEVVEHLHHPNLVFKQLLSCLKPEGVLGIMTKRVLNADRFATWHYKNDMTHVCFFSIETFEWVAKQWGLILHVIGNDVVILEKNSPT